MSLKGAKLICLSADGNHGDIIRAQGRTFKFGYYMDCDVVLEHSDALGLQCTIDCDAFGRVTIENHCPDQPITLDGKSFKKMRPLLHNTEICILDKKYLWQFESNLQSGGFQSEDASDFATPCKQMKKAEQPPMSEPSRGWRTQYQKRLTIHNFAYCIKADESPLDVEITTDENKPLNTYERIISPEPIESASTKRSTSPLASDLIDLKTPKVKQKSFAGRSTPLSCCKFSETVITSYSPRETGVRPEKSFTIVQSPAATPTKSSALPDVSLGPFKHLSSPLTHSHRPSMHLIDLTTPMKRAPPASPNPTLLKSTLKRNVPKVKPPATNEQQQSLNIVETSAASMDSTVYSVHSTDESVIELSDDGSFSPSPVLKTPPRPRTPQSLMKRAILSSAKKAAISKRLQQPPKPPPPTPLTPKNPHRASNLRFQCQSTPQRKSLGKFQSPDDRLKASQSVSGKSAKSMITSTPFRTGESTATTSRRSSILCSSSTSLTGLKNKSRISLMLTHALSKSPKMSPTPRRKSVTFVEGTKNPCESLAKVSFLDRIESEEGEDNQTLNQTFSMEEDQGDAKTVGAGKEEGATTPQDATFSPEKEKCTNEGPIDPEADAKELCSSVPSIVVSNKTEAMQHPSDGKKETGLQTKGEETENTLQQSIHSTATTPAKPGSSFVAVTTASRKDIKRLSGFKPLPGVSSTSKHPKIVPNDRSIAKSHLNVTFSPEKNKDVNVEQAKSETTDQTTAKVQLDTENPQLSATEVDKTIQSTNENLKVNESSMPQTPQSSRRSSKLTKSTPKVTKIQTACDADLQDFMEDDDFEGLDTIFKTPKARNLMILSSPKSISLQKTATDSVELIHSTEFDLSANLDEIFKTPQSEFIASRIETDAIPVEEPFSPEEAFDMLVGRPISRRSYVRKPSPKKEELSPLKIEEDSTLPKTDIEEWIENVNESVELLDEDNDNDEDEMSYLTATTQGEFSRDPLMMSSVAGSVTTTNRKKLAKSPTDESAMTIQEEDEEENVENASALKDPLEMTVHTPKRSLSPNISGIDLLDHTSESLFSETLAVSDESSGEKSEKAESNREDTITCMDADIQISPDKARREMERAFANFEAERRLVESKRLVSTPEAKKPISKVAPRRTMGNQPTLDAFFDLKVLKAEREMELAFEKFEEVPNRLVGERIAKTPEPDKPVRRDMRKTMGNQVKLEALFDVEAAKAEREMELAFENFEEKPVFSVERAVQTPEPQKTALKDHRRTMGSNLMSELKLDLNAAKTDRDIELAFENFEEDPKFFEKRNFQTPEPEKVPTKDYRRTMGSSLVSEATFDLKAAKAQREMEMAFENFEEEPEFSEKRDVQTPGPKKTSVKDHRRTLGSSLTSKVTLDLQAAKAQREMELAFENFEEEPEFTEKRDVQTPEPKKTTFSKDSRRTMGSNLVSKVTLDLKEAKAQREMELDFENFTEEPEFAEKRDVQTPGPKKMSSKDHRRTMGSSLAFEVTFDIKAAKVQREMELAFENFEEEPEFAEKRNVQTPGPKKTFSKDHRRTMGSNLVSEIKLNLKEAKAQRDMELAFENFEEEPEFSEKRVVQTPEPKKASSKDHRRTMGSNLVSKVTLDLQKAKVQREMELAFENFEEEPEFSENRDAQTPGPKKASSKDHRRTMGSCLVSKVTLDLKEAKAQREMELAFENFEEEPAFSNERVVQTPELKKAPSKDHRRTMGSSLVSKVTLDLKEAKAQREMELAFENFEEEPEFSNERVVQTPELKKAPSKDHRRTMGSSLVSKVTLDLKEAKAQREMELAFENFEEEPEFSTERVVQTPEPKKAPSKDHRRTMGSSLVSKATLDLKEAKAQRDMELAFENFEEEPEFSNERVAQTPEPKKAPSKDHRRTMGSSLVSKVTLDLKEAKAQREMELAFENFEEEPEFSNERVVQTPELKKAPSKDHRRTMGSSLVSKVTLDLKEAKAQREMELAFENFEEEPEFCTERVVQTPEPKKAPSKDHRRTMGSSLVPKVTLDLKEAKAQREMELAFENFEEEPEFSSERVVQTPEPKKAPSKDHRRTMGSSLVSKVTLDLKEAKAQREMELAFENFEEEPEFSNERVVQTPEPKKAPSKDHRRTMGSSLVSKVTLDLQAAKAQREMELAFENFQEEPEFSNERVVQTPEPKKAPSKDHRRTMGSSLVSKVTLDLKEAKAQREMELAFENFEEEPEFSEKRDIQTPEPKKAPQKDHRRTMGSSLVSEVKLDLNAAKTQREIELAFENFEEEPIIPTRRVVQTPEPKKSLLKDHRRTMGSNAEVKIDLHAAKAEREMELVFENFREDTTIGVQRLVKTPDIKKRGRSIRMSLGHRKEADPLFASGSHGKGIKLRKVATKKPSLRQGIEGEDCGDDEVFDDNESSAHEENIPAQEPEVTAGDDQVTVNKIDQEEAVEEYQEEPEGSSSIVSEEYQVIVNKIAQEEWPKEHKKENNDAPPTIEGGENGANSKEKLLTPSTVVATRRKRLNTVDKESKLQEKVESTPKSVQSRSQRRRRNTNDEKEKVDQTEQQTTATPTTSQAMSRRIRQNTIDEESNPQDKAHEESATNIIEQRSQKMRRNTVDEEKKIQIHEKDMVTSTRKDQTELSATTNPTDEAEKVQVYKEDVVKYNTDHPIELQATATPTISQPRSRRKRHNTVDEESKPQDKEDEESALSTVQPRSRRGRRNTEEEKVQQPKEDVKYNVEDQTETLPSVEEDKVQDHEENVDEIELQSTATPTISQPMSRRRRGNTTDEEQKIQDREENVITEDQTELESRATLAISQPRCRRMPPNTVDEESKPQDKEDEESALSTVQPKSRRGRRNTEEEKVQQPKEDVVKSNLEDQTETTASVEENKVQDHEENFDKIELQSTATPTISQPMSRRRRGNTTDEEQKVQDHEEDVVTEDQTELEFTATPAISQPKSQRMRPNTVDEEPKPQDKEGEESALSTVQPRSRKGRRNTVDEEKKVQQLKEDVVKSNLEDQTETTASVEENKVQDHEENFDKIELQSTATPTISQPMSRRRRGNTTDEEQKVQDHEEDVVTEDQTELESTATPAISQPKSRRMRPNTVDEEPKPQDKEDEELALSTVQPRSRRGRRNTVDEEEKVQQLKEDVVKSNVGDQTEATPSVEEDKVQDHEENVDKSKSHLIEVQSTATPTISQPMSRRRRRNTVDEEGKVKQLKEDVVKSNVVDQTEATPSVEEDKVQDHEENVDKSKSHLIELQSTATPTISQPISRRRRGNTTDKEQKAQDHEKDVVTEDQTELESTATPAISQPRSRRMPPNTVDEESKPQDKEDEESALSTVQPKSRRGRRNTEEEKVQQPKEDVVKSNLEDQTETTASVEENKVQDHEENFDKIELQSTATPTISQPMSRRRRGNTTDEEQKVQDHEEDVVTEDQTELESTATPAISQPKSRRMRPNTVDEEPKPQDKEDEELALSTVQPRSRRGRRNTVDEEEKVQQLKEDVVKSNVGDQTEATPSVEEDKVQDHEENVDKSKSHLIEVQSTATPTISQPMSRRRRRNTVDEEGKVKQLKEDVVKSNVVDQTEATPSVEEDKVQDHEENVDKLKSHLIELQSTATPTISQPISRRRRGNTTDKEQKAQDHEKDVVTEDQTELESTATPAISQPRSRRMQEKVDEEPTPSAIQSKSETDEEVRVRESEENVAKSKQTQQQNAATPTISQSRSQRRRRNTIDEQDVKHVDAEEGEVNTVSKRRRLQNSVDDSSNIKQDQDLHLTDRDTVLQRRSSLAVDEANAEDKELIIKDDEMIVDEEAKQREDGQTSELKSETKQSVEISYVTRRRRKNSTSEEEIRRDTMDSSGVDSTDDESKHTLSTRKKRLRKVSAASSHTGGETHHLLEPIVEEEKRQRTPSIDQEPTSDASAKAGKEITKDEVHEVDIPSLVTRTSEDEAQIAPTVDQNAIDSTEDNTTSLTEGEIHHIPVAAEEKEQRTPKDQEVAADASAKDANKPVRRRASRKEVSEEEEGAAGEDTYKSLPEVDEIISSSPVPSNSRVRGRRAQLNVVLLEPKGTSEVGTLNVVHIVDTETEDISVQVSKTWQTVSVKLESAEERTASESENTQTEEDPPEKETTTQEDAEIQATPVPSKIRGRRLASKVESTNSSAPAMRRGRRGSIQQDREINSLEVGAKEEVVPSTTVPSQTRGRKAVLKVEPAETTSDKSTPIRRRGRRDAKEDVEEVIPSTPVMSKARGRRAAQKPKVAEIVVEKVNDEEVMPSTVVDSVTECCTTEDDVEHNDDVQQAETDREYVLPVGQEQAISREPTLTELEVPEVVQSTPVPLKTRGRRATVKPASKSSTEEIDDALAMIKKEVIPPTLERIPVVVENSTNKDTTAADSPDVEAGEAGPKEVVSTLPTKTRGRKAALKVEPKTKDSSPKKSEGTDAEAVVPSLPSKIRLRNAALKVEDPVEPTTERSTPKADVQTTEANVDEPKTRQRKPKLTENLAESSTPEVVLLKQVASKTRGRRAPVKAEVSESIAKSLSLVRKGRIRGGTVEEVAEAQEGEDVAQNSERVLMVEVNPTAESSTQEDTVETEVEEVVKSVLLPQKRQGRKAAVKVEPEEPTAESSTAVVEVNSTTESSTQEDTAEDDVRAQASETNVEEVGPSIPLPKARGRKAAVKVEPKKPTAENSTTVVEVNSTIESSTQEDTTEDDVRAQELETNVEEVGPSIPLPKARGRKAAVKAEPKVPTAESSTPARKRVRRGTIDTEEPTVLSSKTHGRSAVLKLDLSVPSTESSTPARKRGRRGAVEHTGEDDTNKVVPTEEDNVDQVVPSKKRGRAAVAHAEPTVEIDSEAHTEDGDIEKAAPSRKRGRAISSKAELAESMASNSAKRVVSAVEHLGDRDSDVEKVIPSKKRGRARALKLEPTDSASESSTPVRKRGRRGAINDDTHPADTTVEEVPVSSRSRGRQVKLKVESVAEIKKAERINLSVNQGDDERSEAETTDSTPVKPAVQQKSARSRKPSAKEMNSTKTPQVILEENAKVGTSEKKSQKKPVRSRRLLSSTSPSHAASEGEQTQSANTESEDKSAKKPVVRGRRAPSKKDTTVESTSHTEEEQPASATKEKPTRGRKAVLKADTSSEKEVQEPKAVRGRKVNTKSNTIEMKAAHSEEEVDEKPTTVSEEPNKKPTRGRKAVQPKSDSTEETIEEQQPSPAATTKLTRGRKVATSKVAKDTDDEQSETQKKPTRTRKAPEPAKEDETAALKRGNRRHLEVPTDDDTPSKRIRKKPKHLLGDEFVH